MTDMSVDLTYLFAEGGLQETAPGVTVAVDGGKVQVRSVTVPIRDCTDREEAFERAVHEMYNNHPDFRFPVRAQVVGTRLTNEEE